MRVKAKVCFWIIFLLNEQLIAPADGFSVSHDLAYQCLMTMPFESDRAKTFLGQARQVLEFQSTIDILKGELYLLFTHLRTLNSIYRSSVWIQNAIYGPLWRSRFHP